MGFQGNLGSRETSRYDTASATLALKGQRKNVLINSYERKGQDCRKLELLPSVKHCRLAEESPIHQMYLRTFAKHSF